jgi:hypothetical protein
MAEPHNMENLMCVYIENLRKQVTNPFRRTWWEPENSELDVNTLRTWWEHDEENTLRTWGNRLQTHSEEHGGNHKIRNLMWTHWELDGNMTRNTHWELEEQITNPFRRTWWEPENSELDVNTLRTWWEHDEENTLRTWGTGYKSIQKNIVGTTEFRTWCEQIENLILMRAWWGTDIGNLRNRLQTHYEEHGGTT